MTTNQIAYYAARENKRHNLAQEYVNRRNLDELIRHNYSSELLDKYRTDSTYRASIYNTDTHYAGTVYSADSSRLASKYSADTSAAAQRYSADTAYQGQVYSANSHERATKYAADQSLKGTMFSAITSYNSAENVANINARASQYRADQAYNASKYAADVKSLTDTTIAAARNVNDHSIHKMDNDARNAIAWQNNWFGLAKTGIESGTKIGQSILSIFDIL